MCVGHRRGGHCRIAEFAGHIIHQSTWHTVFRGERSKIWQKWRYSSLLQQFKPRFSCAWQPLLRRSHLRCETGVIYRFELLCRTVITQDSNQSSSPPKYVSVFRDKLIIYENISISIDSRVDMCNANVQKHQFSNLPAFSYCFEVVTWHSSSVRKLRFRNYV